MGFNSGFKGLKDPATGLYSDYVRPMMRADPFFFKTKIKLKKTNSVRNLRSAPQKRSGGVV